MKSIFLICISIVINLPIGITQSPQSSNEILPFVNDTNGYAKAFQFHLSPPVIIQENIFMEKGNEIELLLALDDVRIHYTTDGSEPTELSAFYKKTIFLFESGTLKAKAFHHQYLPSKTVSTQVIKLAKPLPIKDVTIHQNPHKKYQGVGPNGLIDRKKGTTNFRTAHWMGFAGGDLETVIEFEEKTYHQKVITSLLSDQGAWIFLPESIEIYISNDGKEFRFLKSKKIKPTEEGDVSQLHFEEINYPRNKAKFLKVILKNIPEIPAWHPGKGTAPWLFIDEIIVE